MLAGKRPGTTALEDRIGKLEESAAIKSTTVAELQENNRLLTEQLKATNTVLTDQMKFRWTSYQSLIAWVPGVLGTFFTFGLACAFGYQIYKADEAKNLTAQIHDQRERINSQVAMQAEI